MSFKYSTLQDYEMEKHYKVPKFLFESEKYKDLGLAEKLLYSILLEMQEEAIKNKQVDEEGGVYFIYKISDLATFCNVLPETITRYRKKLIKFGLLKEIKQGVGKPNRSYLAKLY